MAGAIQPDLDLAASLFEALSRATRRGRGIVRDSYGDGEQAAHDITRSAAEFVALSTAKDTPTMENPTDAGAISRSVSSSRKSRIPSTGNRRRNPPRDIGPAPSSLLANP